MLYIYNSQFKVSDGDDKLIQRKSDIQKEVNESRRKVKDLLKETSIVDKYQIFFVQIIRNEKNISGDSGERTVELTEIYDEIDDSEETYQKFQLLKYVAMFVFAYLFY